MPREKTMKVVFAFPTTTMAMKMEAAAKAKEAPLWNGLVRTGCGQSFSGAADRYGTDRNRGLL